MEWYAMPRQASRLAQVSCVVAALSCSQSSYAAYEHLTDPQYQSQEQRELLEQNDARNYMLSLINRDRASVAAPPVVLDEIGTRAGQIHSDEMAVNGYLSHWTMDGRKPDQRYTDAGGKDAVAENAFVNLEGDAAEESKTPNKLELHSAQVFHRYELDQIESSFFNEKPPNDGHRQNIIDPAHTSVGIGLSYASYFGMGVRTACTQEFVNHYGDYDDIPKTLTLGQKLSIRGKLNKGAHLVSIDLRRESMPKAMTIAELNKTSSYGIPDDAVEDYSIESSDNKPPIKVKSLDDVEEFSLDVSTKRDWQPGLYYLCIFAEFGDSRKAELISTRTIELTSDDNSADQQREGLPGYVRRGFDAIGGPHYR